ncbi:outer membrane protein assembly factor BamA [Sphaerochaeta halotolerans]|uniref:Outer membrane protein assembly factor BamA n=1 Tax=Sphaerochaeta halotolerans TaxID=2293840 RepID=A0A372MH14_9SPIR|nr:outer membrane protein assembly factor BamA [Sphaerochaeta halotolerans]MBG0767979.1 outer membrane protein assembly factor BamA [Spirochaetaceae bacterium]MXI86182.1 outer membrane protein assembly factor BamA [Sphaerochaeta halotolerans]RFU94606.1 outer membrane protein assembly factor BamA [Sphaerochaeta halotolerans]
MNKRKSRRLFCAILILLFSLSLVSAAEETPWYMGKRIASFSNTGLQNVEESIILDIQYAYLNEPFSDALFNKLQGELYALDYFSYFLAEAQRTGEGNNELKIAMEFHELPYISQVTIQGNAGIKTKNIKDVLLSKEGTFLQEQNIELSKNEIRGLYEEKGYADTVISSSYEIDETSNTVSLVFTIEENKQKRIGEIVFEGNTQLASDQLAKQLSSKTISYFNSGYYNPSTIETDKRNLITFYQSKGFVDATISDVKTEDISREDDEYTRLRVIYQIDEGEQWRFGGIQVEGNSVFSDEQFQSLISMKEGSILDISRVQKEIEAVTDLYWNNGYIFNVISSDMVRDEENKVITFVLNVQENQQAVVEDIRIEGLTKTKPYVFERELTFSRGDVFSKEALIRSAQNIYNTLIVTDVKFDIINGSEPGTVIPVYTVVEGNQMDIQFGATFGGNVDGFPVSGFLQWSDKNLGGTGRDLAITTNLSPDTQNFSISFTDGWFKDYRWSNGLTFNFERSKKERVLQRGLGSDYYTGHDDTAYPLGYNSYLSYLAADKALPANSYLMNYLYYRVSLGYNTGYTFMFRPGALTVGGGLSIGLNYADYNHAVYDPFERLIKAYGERWQFSNRLSLSFAWDGRDRIENTSRGYYLSQSFTYAGGILGGLSNYIKSSTSASGYVTLFTFTLAEKDANVVLGATTTVSAMLPQYYNNKYDTQGWDWYDAKQGATRYEMLYIDGMNTGRGFSVIFDQAYLWDNQVSVSWPLAHNVLSAEIYGSATGVSTDLQNIAPSSLAWYYSMGAGIKLKVPGFPLGLYLVKNASFIDDTFSWDGGTIFKGSSEDSGFKLVLAITTTLY